ncbi:hypothetical protein [Actinoplanes sp. NPDC051859]|uniref:hypothetical protein n=1 Tax=Actinoplanes sp. NPDC051859 TaxID=3363909 RepID=UPI003791C5A2
MVERVQVLAPPAPHPARPLLVLLAALNGLVALARTGGLAGFDIEALFGWLVVAVIALPLAMRRSWRLFVTTCLVSAALITALGTALTFGGLWVLWSSSALLILAVTPAARWRPPYLAAAIALSVAVPWGVLAYYWH